MAELATCSANDRAWDDAEVRYMRLALAQAQAAYDAQEVPVGCVIVSEEGAVLGQGHNQTNRTRNGTRHAEFEAIDEILASRQGTPAPLDLSRCTLYVTCEPCIMCAGALSALTIGGVVYGCGNDKFGGCGSVLDIAGSGCGTCGGTGAPAPPFSCRAGLLADEAVELLRRFYVSGNPKAPRPHRPAAS
mmetsp:Transcript_1974/g.4884  ORF Transcript_1974/g.4884 Transcript_1974/m.4884 type:complete len:189 (+) Transcript_1974:252-818(+)